MRLTIAFAVLLALTGCGIAGKVSARHDYEGSVAVYRACLADNPRDVQACDGARLSMQAQGRLYDHLSAGVTPFGTHATSVDLQQ